MAVLQNVSKGRRKGGMWRGLLTRRHVLWMLVAGLVAGICTLVMGFRGASRFVVERVRVPILGAAGGGAKGKRGLRVLHLSDLHASLSTPLERLREGFEMALELEADCCVLTGDFITQSLDHEPEYVELLQMLTQRLPCFAVLGNHDGGHGWDGTTGHCPPTHEAVEGLLEAAGVVLLHNRAERVELAGRGLVLVGTGDLWQGECDGAKAFAEVDGLREPGDGVVLLTHNPDARSLLEEFEWDLALCGHTHGGQVVLPLLGAPFSPVEDKRFLQGLVAWKGRFVYVNRGIGSLLSLRLNCPPEIGLIELVDREHA